MKACGEVCEVTVEKLWSKKLVALILATTLVCLMVNMYNLGMTYYADLLKGDIAYAGISCGVFSFSALLSRPFAGNLSNRFDRRKVILVSTALIAAVTLLHGLVQSILALAFVRAVHGSLFSVFSTCSGAEVNAILPRSRLSEGLGVYSISTAIVPAIGPSIFLTIVREGDIGSFDPLFLLATLLCLTGLLVVFLFWPKEEQACSLSDSVGEARFCFADEETEMPYPSEPPSPSLPKMVLGFEVPTLLPAAFLCLFAFAFSSVNFFLPEYAFAKGFGNMGLFYFIFALVSVIIRPFVGKITDKRGPGAFLLAGMCCLCVCYALIPLCPSEAELLILAVPFGLGMGSVAPLLNYCIVERCSAERPGCASAAFYAAYDTGYTLGSPAVGLMIAFAGFTNMYLVCSAIAFAGAALFWLLYAKPKGKLRAH